MYLGLFMHSYFARLNEYKILLITNDTQRILTIQNTIVVVYTRVRCGSLVSMMHD